MSLCILAGGKTAMVAASLFTLSWTHSVEKVEWRETWRVSPEGFAIVEARIKGSGAGMEPPPDARFEHGWWIYVPVLPPLPELRLAASGATPSAWTLCAAGTCRTLGAVSGTQVVLKPCP
ncbi:DUF1850 domain-containing protein [Chelativorans sp. AA-79]|uniref:DUF1850 domain-containing protein n=1 Tax=Chelativorans sp. AA-79 TaxID=3028735 RepID=UPI0023F96AE3|nr:DUF1850 domain-containing protein [Chelativorans sp. AA-79]WEX09370.1 DUF1850 domain-containing protein [Chelativorans sp. AA-79]